MGELSDRMNLIQTELAARYPARVVTRDLADVGGLTQANLTAGLYAIVSLDENDYQNLQGRAAMDGRQRIRIYGRVRVSDGSAPSSIEDAEFAMAEEIKSFVRALPVGLCGLYMTGFRQSAQADHPYGWVTVDLEMTP